MWPLVAAAAASAASSLVGSYLSAEGAKDAARMQAAQEQKALDFQKETWAKTQENMSPYLEAGKRGLTGYESAISGATQPEFTYKLPEFSFSTYEDPGANYQMAQATKALNNSSLARGLGGGGALKAIMAKNQEMAGTAYQNAFNRYLEKNKQDYGFASDAYKRNLEYQNLGIDRQKALMSQGATMASGLGTLGAETSKTVGSTYGNLGSANAAGALGSSNAWTQGLAGATNALGRGIGAYYGQTNPYSTGASTGTPWTTDYNTVGQTNDNLGVA